MAKLPEQFNTYRVKAQWAGTAVTYLIDASDPEDAKERCWKQLDKTIGGDSCFRVDVLGVKEPH